MYVPDGTWCCAWDNTYFSDHSKRVLYKVTYRLTSQCYTPNAVSSHALAGIASLDPKTVLQYFTLCVTTRTVVCDTYNSARGWI